MLRLYVKALAIARSILPGPEMNPVGLIARG
jgi:hypothetical protein